MTEVIIPLTIRKRSLLPIREAYEWKQLISPCILSALQTCFQFVKRMNGNKPLSISMETISILLPIREAYEWKPPITVNTAVSKTVTLLPIREAYEWKHFQHCFKSLGLTLLPIREAYEWK